MHTSLEQLLNYSRRDFRKQAFETGALSAGAVPFSDSVGVHIYSDLRVNLSLSAADRIENAKKYLQVLQAYANAAEAASYYADIRILEVQGGRLHLFKYLPKVTEKEWHRMLDACRSFYLLAKQEISKLIGDQFTIRMAADWGRAILLLSSGQDESESVVSLGVAANRPAKHLAREVGARGIPAGYLAFNEKAIVDPWGAPKWHLVELESQLVEKSGSEELTSFSAANEKFTQLAANANTVLNRSFAPNPLNPVSIPIVRQGFMFRADLDGFSKRVQKAMSCSEREVLNLVYEFHAIMQYPVLFKDQLPNGVSVLPFPWAGDCANLFLECQNYNLERSYLPNTAALKWHDQGRTSSNSSATNWSHLLRNTKWLVAIAGGDNIGADHGHIVTGNIIADSRTFHTGAGWGWQRSLDAEQSNGTNPEETVIQIEDYQALDDPYRQAYRDHKANPTLFKVSPYEHLKKSSRTHQEALGGSKPAIHPVGGFFVPAPRPHSEKLI